MGGSERARRCLKHAVSQWPRTEFRGFLMKAPARVWPFDTKAWHFIGNATISEAFAQYSAFSSRNIGRQRDNIAVHIPFLSTAKLRSDWNLRAKENACHYVQSAAVK